MLNITIMRGDNRQEAALKLPGPFDESKETLFALEAIRSRDVTTAIIFADTSIERLDGILKGMEIDEQELNELEYLSRRIGGLCGGERGILSGALELEKPQSLRDIVNLSCNLHKYELLPDVQDESTMGWRLVKDSKLFVPNSLAECLAYEQMADEYLADHPGVFTDSGFISRKDEPLEMVYDGDKLPEPYCDSDGIITVRLNPKGKPDRVTLTFPASCERIDAALEEIGVKSFDECYASCTSSIPGLLEHLPNYDGPECLNLAAAYLGVSEEQNRLFMAVMEAEVPGSMFELPEITDALSEGELWELTGEWSGQCSDGWGEGFEQREIKIDQGELNVSFWHSGGDFVIQPEAELKSHQEQRPGMILQ